MYIKEIIIDGFKSYSSRTTLTGFDPSFNAITGLNGTGKSNILDSICFVLGISELKQVRVSKLQELVYKQGQAGVTKASVTIVFDNHDREKSPIGYEDYSQITVTRIIALGGRNKYLINGQNAQLSRVQNLFHSVQLNVNNPHFLIMQGRITKVLNMKPPEILGMIEEAAGTRMFETKKQNALKTIEKKESKLKEIDNILNEDITPTLEKLEKQRESYLKWSQNEDECETLRRFCIAYQFYEQYTKYKAGDEGIQDLEDRINQLKDDCKTNQTNIQSLDEQISELKNQKQTGSEFKGLEKQVTELSKVVVKQSSAYQHKKEEFVSEQKELETLKQSLQEAQNSLNQFTEDEEKSTSELELKRKEFDELSTCLTNSSNQLHSINAGIASSGSGKTLTEQLMEFRKIAVTASTEIKQSSLNITHLTKELEQKRNSLSHVGNEHEKLEKKYQKSLEELKRIEESIRNSNYDEKKFKDKIQEKEKLEHQISTLKDEIYSLSSKLSRFDFNYREPEKNFDKSKVKGKVGSLFEMKKDGISRALEVAAGAKLYNVVVHDETTGAKLIEKKSLNERVSFIPLNKIQADVIPSQVCHKAKQIAGNKNADLSLSLIDYPSDIQKAMEYVFGNTIICDTLDVAEKVAFHDGIKKKTVTLEGDVFDPNGSLTGGSRGNSASALESLEVLKTKRKEIQTLQNKLNNILASIETMQQMRVEYQKLNSELVMKKHECEILNSSIKEGKHNQLIEECETIEKDIQNEKEKMKKAEELKKEKETSCKQIEHDMSHFTDHKDAQIKQIEREIESLKKKISKSKDVVQQKEINFEKIKVQIEDSKGEMKDIENQISKKQSNITTISKELVKLEKMVQAKKSEYESLKEELDAKNASLYETENQIVRLEEEKKDIEELTKSNYLEIKKLDHKIKRDTKDLENARDHIEKAQKDHDWIRVEKEKFGKTGTEFDFKKYDPVKIQKKLTDLQAQQQQLNKTVNKKVLSMFERAQQEYKDLLSKKKIVEQDKDKIEQVIKEVDEKKNEAIVKTWEKVNKDFGSIFSTLLPGTNAKLDPMEGHEVTDGLEVKVAFGSVWKESLTELSGGQRSLLALSLILSLLLFKPAPMYILDEIDAALDPSHTQNIGRMLKTHFSNSQFLVVSLKEGMFSNANVIFKTKFVNGQSAVIRTVPDKSKISQEKENQVQPSKQIESSSTLNTKKRKRNVARVDEEEE
eukprot:gene3009-5019_t